MVSDSTNGLVEVWSNGEKLGSYTGNVYNGDNFANIYLQSDGNGTYFSNVIISNSQIGLNENCRVPIVDRLDTLRYVFRTFEHELFLDTLRNVLCSQIIDNDIIRDIRPKINVDNDICRNIIKTVNINFDMVRTMPHVVNYSVVENQYEEPTSEYDTFGIESIEIQIADLQIMTLKS